MNWKGEYDPNSILDRKGRLNKTRLPRQGVSLNEAQLAQLKKAVTGSRPDPEWLTACFNPHHAFVFFDEKGGIVGHLDICFQCWNKRASPHVFAQNWDMESLLRLFESMGMPIENPDWD